MPIYEYECQTCKRKQEILVLRGEPIPPECINCKTEMRRKISVSSALWKGGKPSA